MDYDHYAVGLLAKELFILTYYRSISLIAALLILCFSIGLVQASPPEPPAKRIIAVAVHLDTPKQDWPGLSNLKEEIIATMVAKLSSMVVNQIVAGTGVMETLKEFGIENLDTAEPSRLIAYGRANAISYIVLLSLRTSDFSYSLKAFDVTKGTFLYDGANVPVPSHESSWSFSDIALSPTQFFMKKVVPTLDGQLTELRELFN